MVSLQVLQFVGDVSHVKQYEWQTIQTFDGNFFPYPVKQSNAHYVPLKKYPTLHSVHTLEAGPEHTLQYEWQSLTIIWRSPIPKRPEVLPITEVTENSTLLKISVWV